MSPGTTSVHLPNGTVLTPDSNGLLDIPNEFIGIYLNGGFSLVAGDIINIPAGNVAATDIQTAINSLASK